MSTEKTTVDALKSAPGLTKTRRLVFNRATAEQLEKMSATGNTMNPLSLPSAGTADEIAATVRKFQVEQRSDDAVADRRAAEDKAALDAAAAACKAKKEEAAACGKRREFDPKLVVTKDPRPVQLDETVVDDDARFTRGTGDASAPGKNIDPFLERTVFAKPPQRKPADFVTREQHAAFNRQQPAATGVADGSSGGVGQKPQRLPSVVAGEPVKAATATETVDDCPPERKREFCTKMFERISSQQQNANRRAARDQQVLSGSGSAPASPATTVSDTASETSASASRADSCDEDEDSIMDFTPNKNQPRFKKYRKYKNVVSDEVFDTSIKMGLATQNDSNDVPLNVIKFLTAHLMPCEVRRKLWDRWFPPDPCAQQIVASKDVVSSATAVGAVPQLSSDNKCTPPAAKSRPVDQEVPVDFRPKFWNTLFKRVQIDMCFNLDTGDAKIGRGQDRVCKRMPIFRDFGEIMVRRFGLESVDDWIALFFLQNLRDRNLKEIIGSSVWCDRLNIRTKGQRDRLIDFLEKVDYSIPDEGLSKRERFMRVCGALAAEWRLLLSRFNVTLPTPRAPKICPLPSATIATRGSQLSASSASAASAASFASIELQRRQRRELELLRERQRQEQEAFTRQQQHTRRLQEFERQEFELRNREQDLADRHRLEQEELRRRQELNRRRLNDQLRTASPEQRQAQLQAARQRDTAEQIDLRARNDQERQQLARDRQQLQQARQRAEQLFQAREREEAALVREREEAEARLRREAEQDARRAIRPPSPVTQQQQQQQRQQQPAAATTTTTLTPPSRGQTTTVPTQPVTPSRSQQPSATLPPAQSVAGGGGGGGQQAGSVDENDEFSAPVQQPVYGSGDGHFMAPALPDYVLDYLRQQRQAAAESVIRERMAAQQQHALMATGVASLPMRAGTQLPMPQQQPVPTYGVVAGGAYVPTAQIPVATIPPAFVGSSTTMPIGNQVQGVSPIKGDAGGAVQTRRRATAGTVNEEKQQQRRRFQRGQGLISIGSNNEQEEEPSKLDIMASKQSNVSVPELDAATRNCAAELAYSDVQLARLNSNEIYQEFGKQIRLPAFAKAGNRAKQWWATFLASDPPSLAVHLQQQYGSTASSLRADELAAYHIDAVPRLRSELDGDSWHSLLGAFEHTATSDGVAGLPGFEAVEKFYAAVADQLPERMRDWTTSEKIARYLTVYSNNDNDDSVVWQSRWKSRWDLRSHVAKAIDAYKAENPVVPEQTKQLLLSSLLLA